MTKRMKTLFHCGLALGLVVLANQSPAQQLVVHSQLRRTTDPSTRAARGTVVMTIDANGKQTFQVQVTDLGEANFAPFVVGESIFETNEAPTLPLAPLDRYNFRKGDWSRAFVGQGQAPDDFLADFESLTEVNGNILTVAQPGIPAVTTIYTNIIGAVTNISLGVTNIVGTTTNIIDGIVIPNPGQTAEYFAALWAPLYSLSANPGAASYHRHSALAVVGDASPHAKGNVNISFSGSSGRSLLTIRATGLTRGQQYTLFVSDRTNQDFYVMLPVDNMTQKDLGSTATFVRDTQFADPLPQQARDIGDLSGREVEIRDAFDVVHLAGIMP